MPINLWDQYLSQIEGTRKSEAKLQDTGAGRFHAQLDFERGINIDRTWAADRSRPSGR